MKIVRARIQHFRGFEAAGFRFVGS